MSLNNIINKQNKTLVLWIPGFNDTYFHTHLKKYNIFNNCDIICLHPVDYNPTLKTPYLTENYLLFIPEIDNIINNINYDKIILYSHSSGSLIAILYMIYGKYSKLISGLILNDPFIEFNISYVTKLLINNIWLYPKTWYFKNFFWRFNKNSIIINKNKSFYKSQLNNIDYVKKNNIIINTNIPNIYASFLLASIHAQNIIQNTKYSLLNNMNVLVFTALGNNGVSKLNYLDTLKYVLNISNNIEIFKVKDCYHDVLIPTNEKELFKISKIINNYINNKCKKDNSYSINKKKFNNIDQLHDKILILPNLISIFSICLIVYLFKIFV